MTRFEGKTCVVTGAGGGLGGATAERLAAEGATVVVVDRGAEQLVAVTERLTASGTRPTALAVDQTDREAVDAAVERIVAEHGAIDVLFANAGYGQFGLFLETTAKQWNRHVDVNLTGTFNVCQSVARAMVAARTPGSIVVNASSGAQTHSDLLSAYCTTKAGLRMLAIGMASELGAHRIRVNAIMPGVIESPMTSSMLDDPAHRQWLLSETPVGRLGAPQDIAALVAFLASDEAAYITGESVMVDGGQTIHGHPRWFATDYREPHQDVWEPVR
jgi:NAD(P)-dependent dehydrogenase (short-subunit alcohol dehydrogenase family)